MAKRSVASKLAEAKPGTDLDTARNNTMSSAGDGFSSVMNELEDRLGYLKRMLRGVGAALEAHHEAYGHTEHTQDDHTCCFFELLDAELERLELLAEELEGKAYTLNIGKAVA
jgi:hypothetical protein